MMMVKAMMIVKLESKRRRATIYTQEGVRETRAQKIVSHISVGDDIGGVNTGGGKTGAAKHQADIQEKVIKEVAVQENETQGNMNMRHV